MTLYPVNDLSLFSDFHLSDHNNTLIIHKGAAIAQLVERQTGLKSRAQ